MGRSKTRRTPEPARSTVAERAGSGGVAQTGRRFWLILTGICLLSLVCRVVILSDYVAHSPLADWPVNDAKTYWSWAEDIAGGQLTQDAPFFSAPLYPYLLGLLRAVGGGLTTVYAVQILMDVVTGALLALACRRRFGAAVGLLAAALFLLLQEPASSALRVLVSSLHLLLVTAAWALLIRVQSRPTWGAHIAVGAAVGLLSLSYAPAILLVALVPAWLLIRGPRRGVDVGRAATTAAVAALLIAPATIHNWQACGELIFIRSGGGITLAQGNQPNSLGGYTAIPGISAHRQDQHADVARQYRAETGDEPTWKKVDRYYRNQVLSYWRSHPARAVELAARKLYLFLAARNYTDIYQSNSEIAAGQNTWLRLTPVPVAWLIGPALVGLILLLRHPLRHAPEWVLFVIPLLIVVAFWYSSRYRLPAVPMVVVAAAYALERAVHWRPHWRLSIVVGAALVTGMVLGVANRAAGVDLVHPGGARFNLGYALHQQGNLEAAAENLRAGLEFEPEDADMRFLLANTLRELGRPAEALPQYERVRALRPDDSTLLITISSILLQQGRYGDVRELLAHMADEAEPDATALGMLAEADSTLGHSEEATTLFERALALTPDDAVIRTAYGNHWIRLQRWAEARAEFSRVVQLTPDDAEAHYSLGYGAAQMQDFDAARVSFERVLQIQPQHKAGLHSLGALHLRQGRAAEAAECFRRLLEIDPNDEQARRLLQQSEAGRP